MREFNAWAILAFLFVVALGMILGGATAELICSLMVGLDRLAPLWVGVILAVVYLLAWILGVTSRGRG